MTKKQYKRFSYEDKLHILKQFENGTNIHELNKKYKLSKNTIYNWRSSLKARGNFTNPKNSVTPIKDTDTRTKLYNELKARYEVLETELKEVHRRMTFIGEEW